MTSIPRLGATIPAAGMLVLACNAGAAGEDGPGTTGDDSSDDATGNGTTGTDSSEGDSSDGDSSDDTTGDETGADPCDNPGGPLEDFAITEVSPAEGSTLTLTFNAPVGSLEGVDPNDFRISVAMTSYIIEYAQVYETSQYTDLTVYEEIYPYVNFTFEAITPGPGPDQVVLELDRPIPSYACEYIAYFNTMEVPPGACAERTMLLHHAGGDIPIHDGDGVPLADFGPEWVHEPTWVHYVPDAGFPNFPARVDIPCPP